MEKPGRGSTEEGEEYIEMGIPWCSASESGLLSRRRVSSGEKTYIEGVDVCAHAAKEDM